MRRTLFARLQQFAGRLYGPLIAAGIAWWHGAEGNYWGHNAIIRVRAFAQDAGLPELRGRKPFGGHILSHDFVEAALMRRAGWAIHMAPTLGGSFEECPPSLLDFAARDRRWCQGNLQHLAVLPARGLHWVSRLHLLTGIGSYLTAPLWLIFLAFGILISLQAQFVRPEYFPKGFSLFPQWPAQDPVLAAWVFLGTMGLLIVPKLLAFILLLTQREHRRRFGGGFAALAGILVETFVSSLIAPVMMIFQSTAVGEILLGRDAGWQVQRRDDGGVPRSETVRRYALPTLFGIMMAIAAYAVSLPLLLWMTPVIVGLLLAIPIALLSSISSSDRTGRPPRLFATPEQTSPPPVLVRANQLAAASQGAIGCPLLELRNDAGLLEAHLANLPAGGSRARGQVNPHLAIARAKIEDAESLEEALQFLNPRETFAVLNSRRCFEPCSICRSGTTRRTRISSRRPEMRHWQEAAPRRPTESEDCSDRTVTVTPALILRLTGNECGLSETKERALVPSSAVSSAARPARPIREMLAAQNDPYSFVRTFSPRPGRRSRRHALYCPSICLPTGVEIFSAPIRGPQVRRCSSQIAAPCRRRDRRRSAAARTAPR